MIKFNALISMMFWLLICNSFCMESKVNEMFPLQVTNKNFSQSANDGDRVNVLVVMHKDMMVDIIPLPEVNKSYTFYLNPNYVDGNLKAQLGQIDNGGNDGYVNNGIHSGVWCRNFMVVTSDPTYCSHIFETKSFAITIEDKTSFVPKRAGVVQFVINRNFDEILLRQIYCCVHGIIGAQGESGIDTLALFSIILNKYHSPIKVVMDQHLDIGIREGSEAWEMMRKHGDF